nr:PD40 domain-containing protein [Anaerolineae bacterium]
MTSSTEKRPVTAEDLHQIAYVEDPRVSPDGAYIAYVHLTVDKIENGYKRHIWLMTTDGGKPVQVTRGGKDSSPRWSPDGKTLAFVSARNEKPQIFLLPIGGTGGEARQLTKLENGATSPAWSPDGTTLAFLGRVNAAERGKEDSGEKDSPPANKFEAKQRKELKEYEEQQRWDPRPLHRIPYRAGTSFLDDRHAQVYLISVEDDQAEPRRLTD